jgi:hypothetical protein
MTERYLCPNSRREVMPVDGYCPNCGDEAMVDEVGNEPLTRATAADVLRELQANYGGVDDIKAFNALEAGIVALLILHSQQAAVRGESTRLDR